MFVWEMTNTGASGRVAENVRPKLTVVGKGWSVAARSVVMHRRAPTITARHPYFKEKRYFWKVIMDEERENICHRLVGVVVSIDTYNFHTNVFYVQTRHKHLSAHSISTGQLLSPE